MTARAFLADRIVEIDGSKGLITFRPVRWLGLLAVPSWGSTPFALMWIHWQGPWQVTRVGWLLAGGYTLVAGVMVAMFLSPANRRVDVDLVNRRLTIRRSYGLGAEIDAPLDAVELSYVENGYGAPGNRIPVARWGAYVGRRSLSIAQASGSGAAIVRRLASLVRALKAGEEIDLKPLEADARARGHAALLKWLGTLLLFTAIGLLYAYSASLGRG